MMQSLTFDDFTNGGRDDEELTTEDREDMENERLAAEERAAQEDQMARDLPAINFEFALNDLLAASIKGEEKVALLVAAYKQIEAAFDQLMVEARSTTEAAKVAKVRLGLRVRAFRSDINKPRKRGE